MTSQLKKYIFWFAQEHVDFRRAEIDSIIKLKNIIVNYVYGHNDRIPFWIVELPNDEAAKSIASRSVSIRCILECWVHEQNHKNFHQSVQKYVNENLKNIENLFEVNKTFKITCETYNKHITQSEKVQKIEEFTYLPLKGSVNLKNPDSDWWYIEFYGLDPLNVPNEPFHTLFGKWIIDGQRSIIKNLSLKKRKFIGNTSMDPQLSLLMANQGLVKDGDLVLDPFVGTGSLLLAAAMFGGYVMGCDIDYLMLHGKTKPSRISQKIREKDECVQANFIQYNCEKNYLDVFVGDFSSKTWREDLLFDSIITDPPYGIREATEKIEFKARKPSTNPDAPHYPSTSSYNLTQLYGDLLNFSVKHLKIGGRLVCWIPYFRDDYSENIIPKHDCLELIANSEQILSGCTSRRLLTFEKISEIYYLDRNSDDKNIIEIDFREKYFRHGEETRQERRIRSAQLRQIGKEEALKRGKILDVDGKIVKPEKNK